MDIEPKLEASFSARTGAWSKWGSVDGDVLTHLINPMFMSGPRWPGTRQAYRVARQSNALLIASDGLSDPFDDGEGPAEVGVLIAREQVGPVRAGRRDERTAAQQLEVP